jgi:ubiquinone/menaquinone biosynthesis C-methylase UbiE
VTDLSRRGLFGAGLTRLARARFDAVVPPAPVPAVAETQLDAGSFWAAGDYARLARLYAPAAERLVDALGVGVGDRLLDVAAGDGNVALAAARRGAEVTAVDLAPELVGRGRARAREAGLSVEWHAGDAQALPFAPMAFDRVASAFGVIHAGDLRGAAAELHRVLRPGGRLGLATWNSAGAIGVLLRAARKASLGAPAAGRPERWGSYEGLQLAFERFPGFQVHDETLSWRYEHRDALWRDLADPPGPMSSDPPDAVRADTESRLTAFVHDSGGALELRVDWSLALAHKGG